MRHRVRHITEYRYQDPVPLCHDVAHLSPRETDRQTCAECAVDIAPEPTTRSDRRDFFGNNLIWLSVQEPHEQLRIEAVSEVDVRPFEPPDPGRRVRWEDAVAQVRRRLDPASLDARQFTFDSHYVPRDAALADYARPSFAPGRSLWDAANDLNNRIYAEFKFDSRATTIGTPVLEVLRHRHGVCQDFAHLMVGCLRSLGVPARYVSGYLVTRPPPGKPRLVGCDASHAWVSAFLPDFGWVDFDPTNGCLPSAQHITVGWARDYDDISPVKGVVVGGSGHALSVSVDVEPLTAEPPAAAATPAAPAN
jgi:transglutaminase-like putative cysteine protease